MGDAGEQTSFEFQEEALMTDEVPSSPDDRSRLSLLLEVAEARAADLKRELAAAETETELLSKLVEFVRRDWPIHQCHAMDANADFLKALRRQNADEGELLESIYRSAHARAKRNSSTFPGQIEKAAKAAGLPLNMELSRHPDYYFHGRFFKVHVDDARGRAKVSTSEGELGSVDADAAAVVERLQAEEARVFGQKVVARSFMALVRKAYLAEVRKAGEASGAAVPIRKVINQMKSNDKKFKSDAFLAALAQLIAAGKTAIDGYVMDLQQIKGSGEGVLLPGLEDKGYLGYIIFKKG